MLLRDLLKIVFSGSVFVLLFPTLWRLVMFLSKLDHLSPLKVESNGGQADETIFILVKDSLLLALFVFQHVFMASLPPARKDCVLWRSIYVGATCICLQVLMHMWSSTHGVVLWKFDTNGIIRVIFTLTHAMSWIVMYGGSLLMDFAEMTGAKRVYYNICGLGNPMHQKSEELQRLFAHMRHPYFTGLNVVLWLHPIMTLDRLLLALVLTFTMLIRFNVDNTDYAYQKEQCSRKMMELQEPRRYQIYG